MKGVPSLSCPNANGALKGIAKVRRKREALIDRFEKDMPMASSFIQSSKLKVLWFLLAPAIGGFFGGYLAGGPGAGTAGALGGAAGGFWTYQRHMRRQQADLEKGSHNS